MLTIQGETPMARGPKLTKEQSIKLVDIERRAVDLRHTKEKDIQRIYNEIDASQAKECKDILSKSIPEKEDFLTAKKELDWWKGTELRRIDNEYQQRLGQLHQKKQDRMNEIESEYNAVRARFANEKIARTHETESWFEGEMKKLEEEKLQVMKGEQKDE
jgi:Zn-dependent oligopeptidase